MITPILQNDEFLAAVQAGKKQPGLRMWWLGQSGFLVQYRGSHLLIDPYLSDSLTRKYAGTDKPHVRMTARVVDPARLDFIDVVTSSHNHSDHLDGETLTPLLQANPNLTVLVSQANLGFAAERLQVPPDRLTGMVAGQPDEAGLFTFHAIPAAHESLEVDDQGHHRFIGFIIQAGLWTLYHSGDCLPFTGLAERLRHYRIDVALLPINGRDPQRGVAGNFNGEEAAELAKKIGARVAVPMHFEMFEFNTVSPDEFVAAAKRFGQSYRVLRAGEMLEIGVS
jgi:L-ascorbate metabolism protein UlaG (beta-lactamase superfamily)